MATITGLQTINSTTLLEIDGDPRLLGGLDRDIGDLAIDTLTGDVYIKKTISPTGWDHINQRVYYNATTTVVQSKTGTGFTQVAQLTSDILPVGTYIFDVFGIFQSTATGTGIGFRVGESGATIQQITANWRIVQGGDGTDKFYEYDQKDLAVNQTTTNTPTANTDFLFLANGIIEISSPGTIAVFVRSENNNAVSVRPNSNFNIRRIA